MMKQKPEVEKTVRDIRRHTREKYAAEEKIRIVLEGLRGEDTACNMFPWHSRISGDIIQPVNVLHVLYTLFIGFR